MKVVRIVTLMFMLGAGVMSAGAIHLSDGHFLTAVAVANQTEDLGNGLSQTQQRPDKATNLGVRNKSGAGNVATKKSTDNGTVTTVVKSFRQILIDQGLQNQKLNLTIIVQKTNHILSLYNNDQLLQTYHVDIGDVGLGDKQQQGDHKTPEGEFYLTERSVLQPADYYLGTRWFRLSYPNIEDANRGLADGLIDQATHDRIAGAINQGVTPPQDTALGGGVGIHGGAISEFGSDWTFGCVGLANKDIEGFFDYMVVGTKVVINH